jgi:hypothetical protein
VEIAHLFELERALHRDCVPGRPADEIGALALRERVGEFRDFVLTIDESEVIATIGGRLVLILADRHFG